LKWGAAMFYDGAMANRSEATLEDQQAGNKSVEAELTSEERRHRAFQRAIALKGKIHLNIDINELRGRRR
jgi:hypothetical protein